MSFQNPLFLRFPKIGNIELSRITLSKNTLQAHYHDSFSFTVVEKGTQIFKRAKDKHFVEEGFISVTNPFEVHQSLIINGESCQYMSVYVPYELLMKNGLFPLINKPVLNDKKLRMLLMELLEIKPCSVEYKTNYLKKLLGQLKKHCTHFEGPKENKYQNPGIVDEYVDNNLSLQVKLPELAAHFNEDQFKFSRRFKAQHGLSPINYVIIRKLHWAKKEIQINESLTDVAFNNGFYDQSHFIRFFKRVFGITPSYYKRCLD